MSMALLVCVEGLDGAGKTTLVQGLVAALAAQGVRAASFHSRSLAQLSLGEREPELGGGALSLQDKAFVAYSRLHSHYRDHVTGKLAGADLVLLDRYKWSFLVRWGCLGVSWGLLCSLAKTIDIAPDPEHTLLVAVPPQEAYARKKAAGIALSRAELALLSKAASEREAFMALQSRALGFYEDLCSHAREGSVTQLDSMRGAQQVQEEALAVLKALLERR